MPILTASRRVRLRSAVALLGAALAIWPLSAHAPDAQAKRKGIFWKVSSPTTELHFFGSIHVATADIYPLPAEIESAFKAASFLVVELDPFAGGSTSQAAQAMQRGMYPADDSLDKHISPETMAMFRSFLEKNDLPPTTMAMLSRMKPGLAMTAVTVLVIEKMGMSADYGVDKHFLDAAHNPGTTKRIVELETMEDQLSVLFDLDDQLAEAALKSALKETTKEELTKLLAAWKRGDVPAVEKMALDTGGDEAAKTLNDRMINQRNDKMTEKIADILKGTDKGFVVVGAAHLLGERGIIEQLRKRGFKVEQPDLSYSGAAPAPAAR